MDRFDLDFELNSASSPDVSVDDILAEFQSNSDASLFFSENSADSFDFSSDGIDPSEYLSAPVEAFPEQETAEPFPDDFPDYDFDSYSSVPDYDDYDMLSDEDAAAAYIDEKGFYGDYISPSVTDAKEPVSARESAKKKSVIGSMKDEARRFISQMQSQKKNKYDYEDEEEPAPVYGDLPDEFSARGRRRTEYEYDPDDAYDDDTYDDAYDSGEDEFEDHEFNEPASGYYEYAEDDAPVEDDYYSDGSELSEFSGDNGSYEYGQELDYDADPTGYSENYGFRQYSGYENEPEIDSRFNLGGKARIGTVTYNNRRVDLGADEDYVQSQQNEYNPSQWTPDYDDPLAENNDDDTPKRKKHKFRFGRKKAAPKSSVEDAFDDISLTDADSSMGFSDSEAGSAAYAEADSYEGGSKYTQEDAYFPPTFREYVLSIFASVFLRIRGSVNGVSNQTMSDSEEDLGPELSPAEAAKYYGSYIKTMRLRLRISAVLLTILCYVSLGLPVPNMLKYLPVASAFCFALQSAIMLLALDVITTGVMNAFRLRIGADSLAVLGCLFTGADALFVALSDSAALHMPLCAISSLSVVGLLLAASLSTRGLRKAMRVPAIGKRFYTVTSELSDKTKELSLLKSMKSIKGFVHRTEEAGPDENLFVKIGPFVIVITLLLSVIIAAVKKSFSDFLFIFSAVLVPAVPFASLLAFSLPFFLGSSRIFRSGAAIAGWSGLCDIGAARSLIITDRDLFPESSITMESVRIFADEDAQKVISYAGTMMSAAGCSSGACFMDLMDENYCSMKQVDGFEYLPGGGMKGIIEGHVVLCGSTDLMRLMNVRIPFRITDKTNVLLAIDGILYGIFSLHYEPLPQVRQALVELMRSNRHPVFAMTDFNINPEMLHNLFDIATDGYDFPPYVERFELTKPADGKRSGGISAVLCNEGLGPLTHMADAGRSMYLAIRGNVIVNAAAIATGVMTVFFKLLISGSIPLGFLFVMAVFWALPVILISIFAGARK